MPIFVNRQHQADCIRDLHGSFVTIVEPRQSLKLPQRQICTQVLRPLLEIPIDRRKAGKKNSMKGGPESISVEACAHSRCPMQLSSASQGKPLPWRRLKTRHCQPQLIYLEQLQGL